METLQKIGIVLLSLFIGAAVAFCIVFFAFGIGFVWPFGPVGEFLLMALIYGSPFIGLAVAFAIGRTMWNLK